METKTGTGDTASNIFLTGSIFLAHLDLNGLMDYAVRAAIGGLIWLLFKMAADGIERRRNPGKQGERRDNGDGKGLYEPQKDAE